MSEREVGIDDLLTHRVWLERLAHQLVSDPHAAEDAVQSTWLNALRRPPDSLARARSWLRTVLQHEVFLVDRRGRRRRRHEALASSKADGEADAASDSELDELRAEVAEVFRELSEPYRSTLRQRYFEGLSPTEIAKHLGLPAATVRWRVMTGLERMRAELLRRNPDRSLAILLLPLTRRETSWASSRGPTAPPTRAPMLWRKWLANRLAGAVAILVVGVGVAVFFAFELSARESTIGTLARLDASTAPSRELNAPPTPAEQRSPVSAPLTTPSEAAIDEKAVAVPHALVEVEVADMSGSMRPDAAVLVFRRASAAFEELARTDTRGRASVSLDPSDLGAWGGKGTAGRVALRASAQGWADSDVFFASPRKSRAPVRLLLPSREVVFEGLVADQDGRPVSGVRIEVGYAQSNQLSAVVDADPSLPQPVRVLSDEHGHFRASGVDGSSGQVRIAASRDGYEPFFHVQIVDGASERNCVFVMSPGGVVRGRVRDSSGNPVGAARIWHEPAEHGGDAALRSAGYVPRLRGWSHSTTADAEGRFELTGVPRGTQLLWAQDSTAPRELAHALLDVTSDAPVEWNAQLATTAPFEVALEAGDAALDARTNEAGGWIVRLWFAGPDGRRCIREGTTDASGTASFFDVCESAIDVSVFAPETGFLAARARTDGTSASPLHVAFDPPAHVAGRIIDANGGPFDGLLLLVAKGGLAPHMQFPHDASTGAFDHAVPASAYDLIASFGGSNLAVATFEVAQDEPLDLGTIRVPALATLHIENAHAAGPAPVEYRILQVGPELPQGLNAQVEIGAWPPPPERKLLPADYRLEAGAFLSKQIRIERSWRVDLTEGRAVTLNVAP